MKRPSPTFATLPSGLKLHYRVQGEPGAPWAVLLNGLLSDTTMWAGVLPGLTRRFRVLTFDSRGQGRSEVPEDGPYAVETLAREAWELLQVLEIRRPWLFGLSNGSSISLELLAAHPGAFTGAVLTSCMPRIDFATRLRIQHWIQCLDLGGPLMQFDAAAPYLWGDRFLEERHGVAATPTTRWSPPDGAMPRANRTTGARGARWRGSWTGTAGAGWGWSGIPSSCSPGRKTCSRPPGSARRTAPVDPPQPLRDDPGASAMPTRWRTPRATVAAVLSFVDKTIRQSELNG